MKDFKEYHLGFEAKIVSPEVPGEKSRALLSLQEEVESSVISYPKSMPMAIKRAKGAIVEDVDGNRYIDFFAGCGVLNVGHCNQDVLSSVFKQQKDLIHALDFPTENKMRLINNILSELPAEYRNDYKVGFTSPSGSDAVEAAIKLAKHYTGRSGVLAFQGSYHGMGSGSLAVTSDLSHKSGISSLMPEVNFVPYSYCYRCSFGKNGENCQFECVNYLENLLENPHSGLPKPAAILLEPVQCEGGNIVPKKGYLKRIIELAKKHAVVTIFDEIQTGFFRAGGLLTSLDSGGMADIYTISKGLGGIGFPISVILYKKSIESWNAGFHIGTFRANQVSIAAANGAFEFIRKNDIRNHTNEMASYLTDRLESITQGCEYVGDIRGRGLLIGVEFVKDRHTKAPFPEFVSAFRKYCYENGLLMEIGGHYSNVLRIIPPLIINTEIIDQAIEIMDRCLRCTEEMINMRPLEEAEQSLPLG